MIYEIYWELTADGGARILRVYGTTPEVVLPEQIEGIYVTEIGAYCFAAQARLPEKYNKTRLETTQAAKEDNPGSGDSCCANMEYRANTGHRVNAGHRVNTGHVELRELSGEYLTRVALPDTVEKLGNFAFYNASALSHLEIGKKLTGIGSDAFMNCRKLHTLSLRCKRGEKSGLRQILAQISHDLEVAFFEENGVWAQVLFPEYYESYDEIAPAHLFGRNIEGEGFRARQSFRDGVMDFAQYDLIFPKACAEEKEETLCRLALDRLRYPADLGTEQRKLYAGYLTEHAKALCGMLVKTRDGALAEFLCGERIFARADLECCIRYAADDEWAEGGAYFLRLLNQYFPKEDVSSRYAFEDF